MNEHLDGWNADSVAATHCWWHLALFHLSLGEIDRALALYDQQIRDGHSTAIADLIDASALLWRIALRGGDPDERWTELAAAWAPHIDDAFCSFSDLHAMLAFVGARDWDQARRLERALAKAQLLSTRHGETTQLLGLPACRALIEFGRENDALALTLFESLPPHAYRLGGSHAQRDVLQLTRMQAIESTRRTTRRARNSVIVAPDWRWYRSPAVDHCSSLTD